MQETPLFVVAASTMLLAQIVLARAVLSLPTPVGAEPRTVSPLRSQTPQALSSDFEHHQLKASCNLICLLDIWEFKF